MNPAAAACTPASGRLGAEGGGMLAPAGCHDEGLRHHSGSRAWNMPARPTCTRWLGEGAVLHPAAAGSRDVLRALRWCEDAGSGTDGWWCRHIGLTGCSRSCCCFPGIACIPCASTPKEGKGAGI